MKVSTILDFIDNGAWALPEFQRGYVWNRDQVRGLMASLYRRHPVGTLLVWVTGADGAHVRHDQQLAQGPIKLLLDGQQRITSLYGIIRGKPPEFFDGNPKTFEDLRFHVDREEFAFYSPVKMGDDPLWIDVTELMQKGVAPFVTRFSTDQELVQRLNEIINRINDVASIKDIVFHVDEVTGADKTIDVVVDIFNRVNSGGKKLSKGDLALAKVCASWPGARSEMKQALRGWKKEDYHFELDWLLRCVNTIVTGEARFNALHDVEAERFRDGLSAGVKICDYLLNTVSGRLGLDHHRVLFGNYAFPVMAHYVHRRGGRLTDAVERDRLLYWYVHSALWGRFSGSTETFIDKDLKVLEEVDGGLDRLLLQLSLWRGSLRVRSEDFSGWSLGARFYPMLYMLTRVGEALDWGTGLPLKRDLLGKQNRLEVHHIFPKSLLYKHPAGYTTPLVNAVANFCFLTKDSNLQISNKRPEEYFEEVEQRFPGALASQWIPLDRKLWNLDKYLDFLKARQELLAVAANTFLDELLHGALLPGADESAPRIPPSPAIERERGALPGSVETEEEEELIVSCNKWVVSRGLPEGELFHEAAHPETGEPLAILDLAWPRGLQEGLSRPVALLIDEGPATLNAANTAGFRYFTSVESFQRYVEQEILALESTTPG